MKDGYSNTKQIHEGEYLTYILTEVDKGVAIEFTKNAKVYVVNIEQKKRGRTSMTDYYKFGNSLTYNEFIELEDLIDIVDDLVLKWNFY